MISDSFGSGAGRMTLQAPSIPVSAVYRDAFGVVTYAPGASSPDMATFFHPGGASADLPAYLYSYSGGSPAPVFNEAHDTLFGLPTNSELDAAVLAAQGGSGTLTFVDGHAVHGGPAPVEAPIPYGPTAVNETARSPVPDEIPDTSPELFDLEFDYDYLPESVVVAVPVDPSANVGRIKVAEDNSPMPRDRVMFDYNYFDNTPLIEGGVSVNRFTPGFEKTFLGGRTSFQMNVPMAVTLDDEIIADGPTNLHSAEFGDLAFTFKGLLLHGQTFAISAGLRVTAPTADDLNVELADHTPLVRIANESWFVAPFVGALWTPTDRFYAQGFMQWDVDTTGSTVYTNNRDGDGLGPRGTLREMSFQYIDLGVGYWLTDRSRLKPPVRPDIALTTEIHINNSFDDSDVVQYQNFVVGNFGEVQSTNLVVGTHLLFNDRTMITAGYAIPVGSDQQFDGELRVMFNHFFGPTSRLARANF